MKIGVIFPHDSIEPDAGAIKTYAREVEALGFGHIVVYDHVLGANRASRPGWQGPYDHNTKFLEAFGLLTWLAGLTSKIGLATGVLILPQRQTALVAQQAATIDILSDGRFRLGIGTGWNDVEYEALGMDFRARGRMFDEQIDVLRALWTERAVTFDTPFHKITDAGLWPLPIQRPIPLWFGGGGMHPVAGPIWGTAALERVVRRIAKKADGWLPAFAPDDNGAQLLDEFRGYCREYGRDPATIGLDAVLIGSAELDWADHARRWQKLGATQATCDLSAVPFRRLDDHLRHLQGIKDQLVKGGIWSE
jgi:probable F420-dependent oxidoreductase